MSEKIKIGGVIEHKHLCLMEVIGISNEPGIAGGIFQIFSSRKIPLEFISQSQTSEGFGTITLCLSEKYCQDMEDIAQQLEKLFSPQKIHRNPAVMMLTIYGPHFADKPAVASALCTSLGDSNINIIGISTAINSINCVLAESDRKKARIGLESVFELPDY